MSVDGVSHHRISLASGCIAGALVLLLTLASAAGLAQDAKATQKDGAGKPPAAAGAKPASEKPAAGKPAAGKPMPALPVRAAAATSAPALLEATAVGSLRSDESVVIRPEIAGRIEKIAFDEGQRVAKGALLVTLDAAEVRAQLQSSVAQAKLDQQRFERAEDLYRKNFISQQALDEARSNRDRSAARQREDEAKLAKTVVRAPFSGVAGLRQVSEGAFVAAGTDIARLDKIDQLKLDFRLPETLLAHLKAKQSVSVAVDAYPDLSFDGTIYAYEPAVDEATRTVLVRARVANPDLKLRPGMFARVKAVLARRENAVWVPEQALVPQGRENFVFRVVDGKAERVAVRIGTRKVGEVEVLAGVTAGELIITEGTQKVRPGAPVAVMGADGQKPGAKPAADAAGTPVGAPSKPAADSASKPRG